jgi:membrane protease subunit (stomatin/prohibitin family)
MKAPFIEIIEATTPDPNLLMWKYADEDQEIKNGAKLTVRETQHAMFLNEGQLADVFGPGLHTLSTENIPLLSRLKGWKYGFESPFKADIYFFNTHQFINNKWGTPAPILMKDPEFGQVRIRAFGSFDFKIADVATFFRQYCGTYFQLTLFELQAQLRDFVAPKFGEVTDLSKRVEPELKTYFSQLGIELTQFIITSVTLPEEVTAHYDKMTNINMVKDMDKFTQFNTASAIGDGKSGLNDAVQQGAMLNMMMQQMQNQAPVATVEDIPAKLKQLKDLFDAGVLDDEEFKTKKADLLSKL